MADRSSSRKSGNVKRRTKATRTTSTPGNSAVEAERMLRTKAKVTSYDAYGYDSSLDDEDLAPPEPGRDYGRCGGRSLRSQLERLVCDRLSQHGVAHSHAPRRYEVKIADGRVGAYAPGIVLRVRGREGKTVLLEVLPTADETLASKIRAFRQLYEAEFYVILIAPGAVLDRIPTETYDEAVLPSEVGSLVARLAE